MLTGNLVSIITGGIFAVTVSMCTRKALTDAEIAEEWEKTRHIDNPLSPWVQVYKSDLRLDDAFFFSQKPSLQLISDRFKRAKVTALVAGASFAIIFLFIWPGSMLSQDVITTNGFLVWTTISRGWAFLAAAFIIIIPLIQEVIRATKYNFFIT